MKKKILSVALALTCATIFAGCSKTSNNVNLQENETVNIEETTNDSTTYPMTIEHAFGETVLEKEPERIVTIAWGNQDVPLALGVVPVGMSKANYGVTDDSGLLPWTAEKLTELGVESPVLFDDTDSLDFEAISDAKPDVILAAYSGITQEDYDLLSQIAPVVAYQTNAWQTKWREQIQLDAKGMGKEEEGNALVASLDELIAEKASAYTQLEGKTAAFFYFNPADLGKFYIYLPTDPRAAYLTDLGLAFPESVYKIAESSDSFSVELSAENLDLLSDVDVMVVYGDQTLLEAMQADPLVGTVPAVKNGAVALVEDGTALAASCTPSALSIPSTIDTYLALLGEAANNVR
ncbi:iron-siderophore ABC transporter substrate-binding protein [Anaerosporobacter faecicola]|uniref:iron-siderophore ABC transporter substrate-binding protein n=1 Tax=Anaerosporobacter faecicola TaxID=2718714 RepID=UPI00143AE89B|nr:iron-siderophore ABC transporter substrate-binding protein [Anaerosporobacter faecicola]